MTRSEPDRITRTNAVRLLRHVFLQVTDAKTSMCRVAAECDIFCRGYRALNDLELRRRYGWLSDGRGARWREELEGRANRWELMRQEFEGVPLVCDITRADGRNCRGWGEFSNDDLARFCGEIFGGPFAVTDDPIDLPPSPE